MPITASSENVNFGFYGATYTSPAVTTQNPRESYWAQELAADYIAPHLNHVPTQFTPTQLDFLCNLPPASKQAHMVFVEISGGSVDVPLYLVKRNRIESVKASLTKNGLPPDVLTILKHSTVQHVDIYVNKTDKPVYLVLSAHQSTVWSLHLAQKVHLDGLAVIGNEAQALAHLPPNTPIGFVVNDEPQSECTPSVQRPVDDTWTILNKLKQNNEEDGLSKNIQEEKERHERFHEWLYWRVGLPDVVISANKTSHILIGPKPIPPIPYLSLADTEVIYSPNAKPIWGNKSEVTKAIIAWVGW